MVRPLTPVGRAGGRPTPPAHLAAFVGAVVVAGLLGLLPELLSAAAPAVVPWGALAPLAALVLLAEHTAVDLAGRSRTSVAVVPVLGGSFLFGPLGCLATVLAFAVCAKAKARSPVHRMLFNFGNALLAAEAARWTFRLLAPGPLAEATDGRALGASVLAGLAYYAVLGPLGLGAALAYAALGGAGLAALVAPAGLVRLAIGRHARRMAAGPRS